MKKKDIPSDADAGNPNATPANRNVAGGKKKAPGGSGPRPGTRAADVPSVANLEAGQDDDLDEEILKAAFDLEEETPDFMHIQIAKADRAKQIVYGVVLEPDMIDAQEDYMTADEIEKTAHDYLVRARKIKSSHRGGPLRAEPVESYIAPQDLDWVGQYGHQRVKKGSWVLGVKINDPAEWQKVLDGQYQAFSVGGMGLRDR